MLTFDNDLTEAPTKVSGHLPRMSERDRRRAAALAPRLAPGRYIAVEDGDGSVVIALGPDSVRIGRGRGSDLTLEHMSVSRRHAIIAQRGADHVLLDDRSRNGVFVNGERVSSAVLRDGDAILLGEVALRYLDVC